MVELLTNIYGRIPEWLEFQVGRRFERRGVFFREFICPAGSVSGQIQLRASQLNGISRVLVLQWQARGLSHCSEIRIGVETKFDCGELRTA